ncbi:MAG: amino acid permease, partial [Deltaproteobacteria bacterium]|nr:amino acid permease [Deltaproteobacteria bacterium]
FLTQGAGGFLQAMGYTFITVQGFDLIAAVGGEVRSPRRLIPRSMLLSLALAMAIYLPLLVLVTSAGVEGRSVTQAAAETPEVLVARAAKGFFGAAGYWLILVAGAVSMLSAVQANLLAVSRVALTMARDRTLPGRFSRIEPGREVPLAAIRLSLAVVVVILLIVPDLAAAGAMSSLIFLGSFALTHGIAVLVRRRAREPGPFRIPMAVPVAGGLACAALAVFQAVAVPAAGVLAATWLGVGGVLFLALLGRRARVADASAEGRDPELVRLRGRNPLILVPIANPANAATLVAVADALAPREVARVLLLSVVRPPPEGWTEGPSPRALTDAQAVLGGALWAAFRDGMTPEALVTVGDDPWREIARVAQEHRCELLLLGLGELDEALLRGPLETLLGAVDCDVVILRAHPGWDPARARRILVPSGGGEEHSPLRARLLGHLSRRASRQISFLRVVPPGTGDVETRRALQGLRSLALDEAPDGTVEVVHGEDRTEELLRRTEDAELVVLGVQRLDRRRKAFGPLITALARRTSCPLILISRGS